MEQMDIDPSASPLKLATDQPSSNDVIEGHRACQTNKANWLCLNDIYEKFHRPNIFDIGGTYIDNVPDFWFTCKTENNHGFFLHVFAGNHAEGTYNVALSTEHLVHNSKSNIARFTGDFENFKFKCKPHNQSYITTYSFKSMEVEDILKDKKLYIGVQLIIQQHNKPCTDMKGVEGVMMNHDYMALLKDPVGSDFIIESEDGVEFPVHRYVLSHHSEVFKAMLTEDMAESRTGRVKLVDVVSEDIKIMLEYIYTSTIKDVENINFSNIIMLADRFNLIGLQKLCTHILIGQLAPDTALDILVIADQFDCSIVKNEALKYIKHNRKLFKGSKFNEVHNMALMKELCSIFLS